MFSDIQLKHWLSDNKNLITDLAQILIYRLQLTIINKLKKMTIFVTENEYQEKYKSNKN